MTDMTAAAPYVEGVVIVHDERVCDCEVAEPTVAELYLQVRLGLHLHFAGAVLGPDRERHDLCVVLRADGRADRRDEPVLVEVREFVEDGEGIASRLVPVEVGVHLLDECPLMARSARDRWLAQGMKPTLVREDHGARSCQPLSDDHVRHVLDQFIGSRCAVGPEPNRLGFALADGRGFPAKDFQVLLGSAKFGDQS